MRREEDHARDSTDASTDMCRHVRISINVALMVAVVLAARYAFAGGYLSETDIRHFVSRAGTLAAPAFIVLFALGLLIFASPGLFVGASALAFGSAIGPIYSLLGIVTGACAAFLLGRYVAPDFARKLQVGRGKKIDEWIMSNGLACTISLRFAFFANPVLNYAASQTPVRFRDYTLGSFIGCIPGVFIIPHIVNVVIYTGSLMEMLTHPMLYSLALLRISGLALFFILIRRSSRKSLLRRGHTQEGGIVR